MRVACAPGAPEGDSPDLLVLPEGVSKADLDLAVARHPSSLVVGAVPDGPHMRAYVVRDGINRVNYLKSVDDGRSGHFEGVQPLALFEEPGLAVAVFICIDYLSLELRPRLLEALKASQSERALVCIPADMHGDFFRDGPEGTFPGVWVALSNNRKTYENPWRCRSFIADRGGRVMARQSDYEAIEAIIP